MTITRAFYEEHGLLIGIDVTWVRSVVDEQSPIEVEWFSESQEVILPGRWTLSIDAPLAPLPKDRHVDLVIEFDGDNSSPTLMFVFGAKFNDRTGRWERNSTPPLYPYALSKQAREEPDRIRLMMTTLKELMAQEGKL